MALHRLLESRSPCGKSSVARDFGLVGVDFFEQLCSSESKGRMYLLQPKKRGFFYMVRVTGNFEIIDRYHSCNG